MLNVANKMKQFCIDKENFEYSKEFRKDQFRQGEDLGQNVKSFQEIKNF